MAYDNEPAAIAWAGILIGRQSGIEIGSVHPGRLYVGEIIDHSRTERFELGERVIQWASCRPGPFRERVS
jgi:hypothetical protein